MNRGQLSREIICGVIVFLCALCLIVVVPVAIVLMLLFEAAQLLWRLRPRRRGR